MRLATPRFLSEPVTCVDEALRILVGWEVANTLNKKAEASPPVPPAVAAPPSSSTPPSASSSIDTVNYVR